MKRIVLILIICFAAFQRDEAAFGHGITHALRFDKSVIIEIRYDDGEPMSYADVKIFQPGNDKLEYQNGRTDSNGVFAFVPNKKGEWRYSVSDGMGHGKTDDLLINDDMILKEDSGWMISRVRKLLMSAVIIWAGIATTLYMKSRKNRG